MFCRWIIHALQYALNYEYKDLSIFSLSPSEVNQLLTKILEDTKQPEGQKLVLIHALVRLVA